jgi:hypothetical protein
MNHLPALGTPTARATGRHGRFLKGQVAMQPATEFTMGESVGGIDAKFKGRHACRFVGVEGREPLEGGKFGASDKPAPRMAWVFEVTDGPFKGERFAAETGTVASAKSNCFRILSGLAGGRFELGQKLNVSQFVGKVYLVKVDVNPNSDKQRMHVADLEPAADGAAAPAPSAPPAPPPRPPARARTFHVVVARDGEEEKQEKMTEQQLQAWIAAGHHRPAAVPVWLEGETSWKTAADFGFQDAVPY